MNLIYARIARPLSIPQLVSAATSRHRTAFANVRYQSTKASGAPPPLRHYQEECIDACLQALETGKRRIAVSLATGGGKTVIFANLLSQIKAVKTGNRVLILTHRKELATQAQAQIGRFNPDLKVEIEMGTSVASEDADVVVAGVQSLQGTRLENLDPLAFKAVIIDEAHHAASNSYLKILKHFKATRAKSNVAIIGFTATLYRADTKTLTKAFDHVVYDLTFTDMISDGWLSSVRFSTVTSIADLAEVEVGASGDFKTSSLSKIINTKPMNNLVFKTWRSMTRQNGYKSTIVFCVDVKHVEDMVALFRSQGINAEGVTGATKACTRSQVVEDFRNGDIPVVFNCGVFTEGTDIPNIDLVILNRPTKSKGLMMQMIGRGLRLHPGKDHTAIVDLVGTVPAGMVTAPSLLGLPAGFDCAGRAVSDLLEEKKKLKVPARVEITSFDSLHDFLEFGREVQDAEVEEGEYGDDFANPDNWMPLTPNSWALDGPNSNTTVRFTIIPDAHSVAQGRNDIKATLVTMGSTFYSNKRGFQFYGVTATLMDKVFASKEAAFAAAAETIEKEQRAHLPALQPWGYWASVKPASAAQKRYLKTLVGKSLYMRQSADVSVLMAKAREALEAQIPVELNEEELLKLRKEALDDFVENISLVAAKLWISRLKMTSGELSRIHKASNQAMAQKAYRIMVDPVGEPKSLVGELKVKTKITSDLLKIIAKK